MTLSGCYAKLSALILIVVIGEDFFEILVRVSVDLERYSPMLSILLSCR